MPEKHTADLPAGDAGGIAHSITDSSDNGKGRGGVSIGRNDEYMVGD